MLKIIHGADFHLDSPFAGLSPERAAQRRGEQRELLDRLAGLAREKQADLVLLAGDLLDSERVFRENVHIFTSDALEAVELPGCTLWGRAFSDAHQTACPLEGLAVPGDGRLHIACVHGCVGTGNDYGPITPGEIAASGLDYLALGHVHQGSGLQREGGTWWAYPGCPEGRGFDETGEKGVLYVEAEPGRVTAQFVPLAKVCYEIITADITGPDGALFNILEALPGKTSDLICRLILTGEGDAPNLANLQQTLAPEFYGLTLIDRTRLPQDLWTRREEDALTGLFLRTMWDKCQGEPDNPLWQLAARYGLAALEGGEEV